MGFVSPLLFWLAGELVRGFHVDGFWNAFFGSIIVSLVNWALSAFTRGADGQIRIVTHYGQVSGGGEKVVEGKVIE